MNKRPNAIIRFLPIAAITSITLLSVIPAAAQNNHSAPAVVFDNDADFDDTVALALLAEQHLRGNIDLRAVTVTNNGAGLPGKAYLHTRCLLDSLGLPQIPVADATYSLPHAFPPILSSTIDIVLDAAIPDCPAGHVPPSQSASELLASVLQSAHGQVTLIATGPLTNVGVALNSLSKGHGVVPASLVNLAYLQSGAIHVAGGLEGVPGFDNSQTLNTWGDPTAAETVFNLLRPGTLHLVPHDATDFVPIRLDYITTLTAQAQTPAAQYVARLMNHPILHGAIAAGLPAFWWDPLAAVSALQSGIVDYTHDRISVIQDGVSSGRTIEDPNGPLMWVGLTANAAQFEAALIRMLNGN
jgi:purine nucleosidase